MKRIDLPVGGIVILVGSDKRAFIKSRLRIDPVLGGRHVLDAVSFNTAVTALEQMIIGHIAQGVEVDTPEYIKGLIHSIEYVRSKLGID